MGYVNTSEAYHDMVTNIKQKEETFDVSYIIVLYSFVEFLKITSNKHIHAMQHKINKTNHVGT